MRFLGVVLVSLALAPCAQAAYPGTHREVRLEAAASRVAGKTVDVYCADSPATWTALVTSLGGSPAALGFAFIGASEAYYGTAICEPLLATSGANDAELGKALLVLTHEALHLSGITDEYATDCTALSDVWGVGFLSFGIGQPRLGRLYRASLAFHLSLPEPYRHNGSC